MRSQLLFLLVIQIFIFKGCLKDVEWFLHSSLFSFYIFIWMSQRNLFLPSNICSAWYGLLFRSSNDGFVFIFIRMGSHYIEHSDFKLKVLLFQQPNYWSTSINHYAQFFFGLMFLFLIFPISSFPKPLSLYWISNVCSFSISLFHLISYL